MTGRASRSSGKNNFLVSMRFESRLTGRNWAGQKNPANLRPGERAQRGDLGVSVVADGFYGTALKGFHAQRNLFFGRRLFMDKGIPTFIVAGEKSRSSFATQIAVDALLIDIKLTWDVRLPFVSFVSHRGCEQRSMIGTVKRAWSTHSREIASAGKKR